MRHATDLMRALRKLVRRIADLLLNLVRTKCVRSARSTKSDPVTVVSFAPGLVEVLAKTAFSFRVAGPFVAVSLNKQRPLTSTRFAALRTNAGS